MSGLFAHLSEWPSRGWRLVIAWLMALPSQARALRRQEGQTTA